MSEHRGDLVSLVRAGIGSLVNALHGNGSAPIPFQRFLEHTGLFLDRYVSDTSRQEHLTYVGGKMTLRMVHDQAKAADAIPIRFSAELYFQTSDGQWVLKQKHGQVDSFRFTDWNSDETAISLQCTGKLELSVEPPDKGDQL